MPGGVFTSTKIISVNYRDLWRHARRCMGMHQSVLVIHCDLGTLEGVWTQAKIVSVIYHDPEGVLAFTQIISIIYCDLPRHSGSMGMHKKLFQ
jgi:hypothetical protein